MCLGLLGENRKLNPFC